MSCIDRQKKFDDKKIQIAFFSHGVLLLLLLEAGLRHYITRRVKKKNNPCYICGTSFSDAAGVILTVTPIWIIYEKSRPGVEGYHMALYNLESITS